MAVTDAALQEALDVLTSGRVVDIYQHLDNTHLIPKKKNGLYCVVRINYNDATYALANGKACWVEVSDVDFPASAQAAELLEGLSSVGPLDPDMLS